MKRQFGGQHRKTLPAKKAHPGKKKPDDLHNRSEIPEILEEPRK